MKAFFSIFIIFLLYLFHTVDAEVISTVSPDKNISIRFMLDGSGTPLYKVTYKNTEFLTWSKLGLTFLNSVKFDKGLKRISVNRQIINETYPVIAGKSKYSTNYCNETKIILEDAEGKLLELYFRAYNDGAAFRYIVPEQNAIDDIILSAEDTKFNFARDYTCWALKREKFRNSYEGDYKQYRINNLFSTPGDSLKDYKYVTLPMTVEVNPDLYVCVSEANITNYAGMYLVKGNEVNSLRSILSPDTSNPAIAVRGVNPLISPWRAFIIASTPGKLIESNLILNLNEPSKVPDAESWVKPGKSVWNWWAENRGYGNTYGGSIMATGFIKDAIDFASLNSFEYYSIDGGWYGWFDATKDDAVHDITKSLPELDLPEVVQYANSKNVGIFVWVVWYELERQFTEALNYYQQIGIKGIKVDFMDRDDQYMVDFYHKLAKECAARKILVSFHGAYKPDGLERTYPNIITREAVLGNEYSRWITGLPNPEYNVTIPFTRMVVGGMDFTPGSMRNATKENWIGRWIDPMTKGTRAQQMAMLVVYQSGITTLCESPKIYELLPEFNFIKQVPASWDSTIVLEGKIRDYVVIARKKDGKWFLGAMTDWNERYLDVDFGFLGKGRWQADIYRDTDNANINPQNVTIEKAELSSDDVISFYLAQGGGLGIILKKL